MESSFPCPHCGADVPARARSCRGCGSDLETGWSGSAEEDSLELPEPMSEEDYGEFLARELPGREPPRVRRRRLAVALLGITLALLFLWWATRRFA